MSKLADNTPILVGAGQITEAVPEDLSQACSHTELAGKAAALALEDARDLSLANDIDTVVAVRTFADSTPAWACPFGGSNNFPRSVAQRIGANPDRAVYGIVGGQSPQQMLGEFFEKLHAGDCQMVLLCGGEVMANIKVASKQQVQLDWNEHLEGQLEDRGKTDGEHLITRLEYEHQLIQPLQFYGLMENARRGDLGLDVASYNAQMGECFAKLSHVAATNPHAINQTAYSAEQLLHIDDSNPMLASPYPKHLIAKDGVNQAAALLLTTVGKARELGIDSSKWIYLHGYADTKERCLLERHQLGHSAAMKQALLGTLRAANKSSDDIAHFDIYSCFPIVVTEAQDILGIAANDPRPMTQTGGLAFFGGPGNNYTMHGIASLVETLRADPGSFGLAYGNGGWMSKHSAGIYSTQPPAHAWQPCSSAELQALVDADPKPEIDYCPNGEAVLESYTVNYLQGKPLNCAVVGRLKHNNKRFYALNAFADADTLSQVVEGNVLHHSIYVEADPKGNRFAFSLPQLQTFSPPLVDSFQDSYEFCTVERRDHTLIVTINRPEARNALSPPANQELEGIFNAYEKDRELWVAILTGAGSESFSAGQDMKYLGSGQQMWIPKTGFAGLTSRVNRNKPVIAALNGSALGGGLEIAMACDMIVASKQAQLGLPEVKVGLFAGAGGVQRLSRQIGLKKAVEMILTGQAITAAEALELGLINYAVPADQVMAKALALAEQVCQVSPVSVQSSLQLLNESSHWASTDDAVTQPHRVFDNLLNSDDFYEGTKAFIEKRPPRWTGR